MKNYLHYYYAIFMVLNNLFSFSASMQNDDYCSTYDEINKYLYSLQYDSAYMLIDEQLSLAEENENTALMAGLYFRKGVLLGFMNEKERAIHILFKARELFQRIGDEKNAANATMYLAVYRQIPYEDALQRFQDMLCIYKESFDTSGIQLMYANLGFLFGESNLHDSAIYYFQKAYFISKNKQDKSNSVNALSNIGVFHFNNNNYKQSIEYSLKAIQDVPESKPFFLITPVSTLMEAYFQYDKPDSTLYYYGKYNHLLAAHPDAQARIFKLLSQLYASIDKYDLALEYYQQADSIQQKIQQQTNKNLLHVLELEHQAEIEQEQRAQLHIQAEKEKIIRTLLVVLIFLLLTFVFIVFRLQKAKARKKRELYRIELQNTQLQRKYLHEELKYTNKEFSSLAVNMVQNSNLLKDLREYTNRILKEKDTRKGKEQLIQLNKRLTQLHVNDEQRHEFMERSQKINHALVFYLKRNFPQLSDGDINLLILLLLKFSSKEISILYNIEHDSVNTRRWRLRRKLGIKNRILFEQFFDDVIADFQKIQQEIVHS